MQTLPFLGTAIVSITLALVFYTIGTWGERLQKVLKIINDNITDKNLSPHFIADALAISTRSLYRKMEAMGGENLTGLIRSSRLHVAKNMLQTTQKTIDEIVFASGFTNKVTFFKAFKEKYGCTPKEYRTAYLDSMHKSAKGKSKDM